jgi:hypothetical protein
MAWWLRIPAAMRDAYHLSWMWETCKADLEQRGLGDLLAGARPLRIENEMLVVRFSEPAREFLRARPGIARLLAFSFVVAGE